MIIMIFSMSVGFLLLLSGFMKLISPNFTAKSLVDLGIISLPSSKLTAVLFSIVEIFLAIFLLLLSGNFLVNLIGALLFSVFLLINIKFLAQKVKVECSCFGNLLKTELGYGGIAQSFIMLIISLLNILNENPSFLILVNNQTILLNLILVIVVSMFGTATLIFIRSTVDTISRNV